MNLSIYDLLQQRGVQTVCANALAENAPLGAFIRNLGVAYTADVYRGELTLSVQLPWK